VCIVISAIPQAEASDLSARNASLAAQLVETQANAQQQVAAAQAAKESAESRAEELITTNAVLHAEVLERDERESVSVD